MYPDLFKNRDCERRPKPKPTPTPKPTPDPTPSPDQCDSDETHHWKGYHYCDDDCDCRVGRKCSPNGYCLDCRFLKSYYPWLSKYSNCEKRPKPSPKPKPTCGDDDRYWIDEIWNARGPFRCYDDCDCSGNRLCSPLGFCHDCWWLRYNYPLTYLFKGCKKNDKTKPIPPVKPCTVRTRVDEYLNELGPNRCRNDCECDLSRRCSPFGFCHSCWYLAKTYPSHYKLFDCKNDNSSNNNDYKKKDDNDYKRKDDNRGKSNWWDWIWHN